MTRHRQVAAAAAAQALSQPYHRIFTKQDGGFDAFVLELPGVNGGGADIEEANRTLEEGMADWVAFEVERGHDIPAPLDIESFSGRLTFRIPPGLHYQAALLAAVEGVSLNRLLSDFVAQGVGMLARTPGQPASGARRIAEEPEAYASSPPEPRGARGGRARTRRSR